jgi:hypothetical protein
MLSRSKTLRSSASVNGRFILGLLPFGLSQQIRSGSSVTTPSLRALLKSMLRALRSWFAVFAETWVINEFRNAIVMFGDLSNRVIRAPAEKLQKLRTTAAIESHRRWSSLRLLAIKPIVQIFAQASPHNSFTREFLMQSIQNRLCLPQTPLCRGSLFVFIREPLRPLTVSFFRRDSTLPSV